MKINIVPTQEYLKEILDYNPETGIFIWKHNLSKHQRWNTRYAGKYAGTPHSNGYLNICINYIKYRAHRLAWVYVYGDILDEFTEVDHKNRERSQNWISNLRLATKSQNCAYSIGKSRCGLPKGVEKNKSRFTARIMKDGMRFCLGTYNTPEEAHAAYCAAAKKYHGEFARAA